MIGTQIANYRIDSKLGEGGMGIVYKGVDVNLDRPVAIKLISSDLSRDPALIERFQSEAKAQANLNQTNIATLYSFLNVEGNALMVMEYVEGETVEQMLARRGPIPWEEAIPIFKQALLGVGFAHRMGIIHRDIKPSNIMMNRNGIVKVMDFGIAKVLGGRRLTRTGTQMGTVAYMSPEQIRNQPVDIRSDIYALGVTLYEMLTAHVPFESESEFQVMSDHVNTPPPPPTRFYPYIPPGIEQAVLMALEKNPDARFQTVEAFGAALEHPQGAGVAPGVVAAAAAAGQAPPIRPVTPVPTPPPRLGPTVPGTVQTPTVAPRAATGPFASLRNKLIAAGAGALVLIVVIAVLIPRQHPSSSTTADTRGSSGVGALVTQQTGTPGTPNSLGPSQGGSQQAQINPSTVSQPTSTQESGPGVLTPDARPKPAKQPRPVPEQPKVDPSIQMIQNAEAAFSSGRLLEPREDSAIYWARQAEQRGNSTGYQIDQQVYSAVLGQVEAARQQGNYDRALDQLFALMEFYPRHTELQSLRATLVSQKEELARRREAEAQIKRFTFTHRHILADQNFSVAYCGGILQILPDGTVRYDCTQTNDPEGRCDHVSFPPGSIKDARMTGDGFLHIASRGMGNFDFYGRPVDLQNALSAIVPLVNRGR